MSINQCDLSKERWFNTQGALYQAVEKEAKQLIAVPDEQEDGCTVEQQVLQALEQQEDQRQADMIYQAL